MSSTTVSIDPDQATASVTKLADAKKAAEAVRTNVHSVGADSTHVTTFKWYLDNYVGNIKTTMDQLQAELEGLQKKISETILELGERDETLAGEVTQFTQAVEEVATPSITQYTPGANPTGTNSASQTKA